MNSVNSSSLYHSAYDEVSLRDDSNSSDEMQNLPFIDEERIPLRRNTPPILRIEQSLHESNMENSFMGRSRGLLPDLNLGESRESYYWRWIAFGVPAFYGLLLAFVATIRTFAGYHDYMTKFAFWWFFTFGLGILGFRLYTNWKKKRDAHFLSWWEDRPLEGSVRGPFDDNL